MDKMEYAKVQYGCGDLFTIVDGSEVKGTVVEQADALWNRLGYKRKALWRGHGGPGGCTLCAQNFIGGMYVWGRVNRDGITTEAAATTMGYAFPSSDVLSMKNVASKLDGWQAKAKTDAMAEAATTKDSDPEIEISGKSACTGWDLSINGRPIVGTTMTKADAIAKAMAPDVTTEKLSWNKDPDFAYRAADYFIAAVYLGNFMDDPDATVEKAIESLSNWGYSAKEMSEISLAVETIELLSFALDTL